MPDRGDQKITKPTPPHHPDPSLRRKPRETASKRLKPVSAVADRAELLRVLTERARAGNVAAAKALLTELRLDERAGDDAESTLDRLDNVAQLRSA